MTWNWQRPEWPDFAWDQAELDAFEKQFLLQSGELVGAVRHIEPDDQNALRIDLISDEAVKTSEIEGEILNRDSVQSSLRHQLGLDPLNVKVPAAERGIATMMVDLYRGYASPRHEQALFDWHTLRSMRSRWWKASWSTGPRGGKPSGEAHIPQRSLDRL